MRSKPWCSPRSSRCRPPCSPSSWSFRPRGSRSSATSSPPSTSDEQVRARAGARRGRLSLPDAPRRVRVRRAVRARRPDRTIVGPCARDARDHRLQTADRIAAQMSAIRGVNVDATLKTLVATWLRRGERPRAHARQSHAALRHHASRSSNASASTRSTDLPSLADFVPEARRRRGARAAAATCPTIDVDAGAARGPTSLDEEGETPTRRQDVAASRGDGPRHQPTVDRLASGCRRCWLAPASGSRRTCEELIAAGRVTRRR